MRNITKIFFNLLFFFLLISCNNRSINPELNGSKDDLSGKKIGVLLGSSQEDFIKKEFPNSQLLSLEDNSILMESLLYGQCDLILMFKNEVGEVLKHYNNIEVVNDSLLSSKIGVCFNTNDKETLLKFNSFLKEIKANGQYDDLVSKWESDPQGASLEKVVFKEIGPPLRVGTSGTSLPFSFLKDGKLVGIDIDLCSIFAASLGRRIEVNLINFNALIPSLISGKVDMIASSIVETKERSKAVGFSDPYYNITSSLLRRNDKLIGNRDGSDFSTSSVGVMTGSLAEMFLEENYPSVKLNCYDDITDAITALSINKSDYVMTAYTTAVAACRENKNLIIIPKEFTHDGAVVALPKNCDPKLLEGINNSIKRMKKDGTLEDMIKRWITDSDLTYSSSNIVLEEVKSGNTLKVGISANREPMCFVKDGEFRGLDIELLRRICFDIGMKIQFIDMKFSALTAALMSSKVDIVASNFTATPERAKSVTFSESYFTNPQILITIRADSKENISEVIPWYQKIKKSFYNNLVLEKRYLLILNGLLQTVIISIFSILLGTLLGAGICSLRMSKKLILKRFAMGYIDVMRGTPILVLLMIVFYVVFAKSDISATSVAILTFAMNFAAYVSEMFRTSIEGIDKGQKEAGIAMGFTNAQTFRFIILPQAVKRVLPIYKGEVISLVKMTSVVGYIAVQDLTKASDIIRSRTFDAFFPLIVITILYFLLAWLFGRALDLLNKKTVKQ